MAAAFDSDLVHHAPAAEQDPVGPQLAHLEPCGLLLLAGMVDSEVID
jgi:hypothetical protein